MAKQDKVIAAIVLLHSSAGLFWVCRVAAQAGFPIVFLGLNLVLAAAGIAGGIGWLTGRRLGLVVLAFYLAQLIHVITPVFQWSFTLGFNLNVTFGWVGDGELGVNLVALGMLGWAIARILAPDSSFKSRELSGSPA
jgi:hypothetical protein